MVATIPRAVMTVHADDGDGGAAEESSPPISATVTSLAESLLVDFDPLGLQVVPGSQDSVAPLGQQASKVLPEEALHELGDKFARHTLPKVSVHLFRPPVFPPPLLSDPLGLQVVPGVQDSVAPMGQQASKVLQVDLHVLGVIVARHRLFQVSVHLF